MRQDPEITVEMLACSFECDLWRESGRYETYGKTYKLKTAKALTYLGPTYEIFTAIVRDTVKILQQLPLNLYQIQPKYQVMKTSVLFDP